MDRPVSPPTAATGDPAAFHELLLTEQSRRWEAGERALVEHYLQNHPEITSRAELILDLIYHEFLLRKRNGERPTVEEYVQRFPQLANRVRVQLELDHLISDGLAQPDTFNDLSCDVSAKDIQAPLVRVVPVANADQPSPPAEPDAPLQEKAAADAAVSNKETAPVEPEGLPSVAGYEIVRELGRGGMGVVYQARHLKLNRVVALKMVRVGHLADPEDLVRFLMEGEVVARIHHPNIVQIYEVGAHNHLPYFALEYIDGGCLTQQLSGKAWPAEKAAALIETLARAIHAAHQQGIIHCDLKPGNILLTADGVPKVTDFGLFRQYHETEGMTAPKAIMGTPTYMSPEQAKGLRPQLGPGTDVYALGVILYQLLTGDPPFSGFTPYETLHRVVAEEPRPLSQNRRRVPVDLETICLKCLRKQPIHRYATAADLADDLRRFLAGNPIAARPLSPIQRGLRWARRHPSRVLFMLLLISLVGGGSLVTLLLSRTLRSLDEESTRAQHAEALVQQHVWEAALERAKSHRLAGGAGQRLAALEEIRQALRLPLPAGHALAELRDEATACLLLDDVQPATAPVTWPAGTDLVLAGPAGERYVRSDRQGNVVVGRFDGLTELTQLPGYTRLAPFGLGLSPDGRRLWAHFADGRARLWKPDGPGLPKAIDLPAGPGAVGAFSADGRWLALDGTDGFVRIVETDTGDEFRAWRPGVVPKHIAFHPSLPRIAVSGGPDVRILDIDQGHGLAEMHHAATVTSLAWHPRDPLLATACTDGKVRLWDTKSAQLLLAPFEARGTKLQVAFNHAGDRLLTSSDGAIRLWEARTGRLLLSTEGHVNAFRSDDQMLLASALPSHPRRSLVALSLRFVKGDGLRALPADHPASSVCLSPDGRFLAVSGKHIQLLDGGSDEELAVLPVGGTPLRFDPTGDLWTIGREGARRWPIRVDAGTNTLHIGPPRAMLGSVHGCSDAGRLLVSRSSILEVVGERTVMLEGSVGVKAGAISPDGRWVAAPTADDAGVTVWDAGTGGRVKTLPTGDVTQLGFSPDSRWLGIGGTGVRLVKVGGWDEGPQLSTPGETFAFSPDGQFVAVPGSTGQILVLRTEKGETVIRLIVPEGGTLLPRGFDPDGASLLATSADRALVYRFDLRTIRAGLRDMGFEVSLPEYPPKATVPPPSHLRLVAE